MARGTLTRWIACMQIIQKHLLAPRPREPTPRNSSALRTLASYSPQPSPPPFTKDWASVTATLEPLKYASVLSAATAPTRTRRQRAHLLPPPPSLARSLVAPPCSFSRVRCVLRTGAGAGGPTQVGATAALEQEREREPLARARP